MKSFKIFASVLCLIWAIFSVSISSCKKESELSDKDMYVEGWTRVIGIKGTDTSTTPYMNARVETVGLLMVEDAMLKAELMTYTPLSGGKGQYVIKMTNKQPCQVILRWMWEGLLIDQITPTNDVLTANQSITFTLIGDAKPGRIKVKAEKSNSTCSNSSTLILEISTAILPITYTTYKTYREGDKMIVTFSTETPQDVNNFFVMWSPDGDKVKEVCKYMIGSDGVTKSYKISYPAVKKEDTK